MPDKAIQWVSLGRVERYTTECQHAIWNGVGFKTCELFISGTFHLIFSNHNWPRATETSESGTPVKTGFLYLPLQRSKAERGGGEQEVAFQQTDFQQVERVNRQIEEPTKGKSLRYSILKLLQCDLVCGFLACELTHMDKVLLTWTTASSQQCGVRQDPKFLRSQAYVLTLVL